MIEAHTGAGVRAAEQPLLEQGHGDLLMRRAALGLARVCETQLRLANPRRALAGTTAVVLAGSGNNGGDGLWAGSFLRRCGVSVTAVLTGSRVHEEGVEALLEAGGTVLRLSGNDTEEAADLDRFPEAGTQQAVALMSSAHVVVDAMLGTGASGGLRGGPEDLVTTYLDGEARARVVACDIVSGVSADTGEVPGTVLPAHATVTFGTAKSGHVLPPGEQVTGELTVVPIGIEDQLGAPDVLRVEPSDALTAWPRPTAADHKYSRGVIGVVAGTAQYPGAAVLATTAAVNSGAGMVRYLGDAATRGLVLAATPEVVCSEDQPWDVHVQAWLAGPGVAGDETQQHRVQAVVEAPEPAVLDAGALTAAARTVMDGRLGPHTILTPHAGELAQIFEWLEGLGLSERAPSREEVEAAAAHWAREAARITGATVLVKGATTVIASPVRREITHPEGPRAAGADVDPAELLCLSVSGASPWLATAGSGDTLSGILGTVVAQVAEHPGKLAGLGTWATGEGRWAAAAALGASVHAQASLVDGEGPVPPTVLSANVRTVLRTAR